MDGRNASDNERFGQRGGGGMGYKGTRGWV
jgi:hypothetical protein